MSVLRRASALSLCLLLTLGVVWTMAAQPQAPQSYQDAEKLFGDGNYAEAYDIVRRIALDAETSGPDTAQALELAVRSLQQLQRVAETDALFKEAIAAHPDDWHVLWRAGHLILNIGHYGNVVAGEFQRGNARGGGRYINVETPDRLQALRWLDAARLAIPEQASTSEQGQLYQELADALIFNRRHQQAWQLQELTDLNETPDWTDFETWYRGVDSRGAPVNADGEPVFYTTPESFEDAQSDGQRWRWCLLQVAEYTPDMQSKVRADFADFLHEQFGVQTLQQWGIYLPRGNDDDQETQAGIWSVSDLSEEETIARLANGVKRFTLPEEFNFIAIYQDLAQQEDYVARNSLIQLASIFENRRQFDKAAEYWQEAIRRFPQDPNGAKARLEQIVGNWGTFETVVSQPAGQGAQVDYRFRNGKSVKFTAYEIKVPQLLNDIKAYLRSNPEDFESQRLQIDQIGYRIVRENQRKYQGARAAQWTLELEPRPHHYDRRVTVTTPLQKAGAYLLIAEMENGNTSRIVVWLNDTAIVKKYINHKTMYYVADATSGEPIPHAHVEFFGWKMERHPKAERRYHVLTQSHAEFTNNDGLVLVDKSLMPDDYQWLAVAKTEQGRFAHLGFSGVWYSAYDRQHYSERKVYVMTDRPVYRPDQKVQYKLWIRHPSYDQKEESQFGNQTFRVRILDPQGTEVAQQEGTSDRFGGITGDYMLPKQAPLGSYSLQLLMIDRDETLGIGQFRVEEYKKPEFEVTIDAPDKPAKLGEKVTATINAKYYYGAPVTNGKLRVKVERSSHEARWYPVSRWDWLYGNGYWWFASDTNWYPGFGRWGCIAPRPIWWNWYPDPPELVLNQELTIGEDGTAEIEIDTALAKAIHSDQDHEYSITAEVTDASRRTIVGQGNVLVSREPYKVFAWTDRGHYHVDDAIQAHFQARRLDGKGVQGSGTLQLLKVHYEDNEPVEVPVQEWKLSTDEQGQAQQTIKATKAGQYRLSFKMSTGDEAPVIEGGYLFVIRGPGFNSSEYLFNDLELVLDKKEYQPGDKVQLLINTNRADATILLFVRPLNGIAPQPPQILHLKGKSAVVELDVEAADLPNFFVEAVTIHQGNVFDEVQEIVVPPTKRILNVEVTPSSEKYRPGEKAEVEVKVTGPDGKPFAGSLVLAVYDRAVEYISGGSNVEDIKEFFWKWRRSHLPQTDNNLERYFGLILKDGESSLADIGIFGAQIADDELKKGDQGGGMGGMGGGGFFDRARGMSRHAGAAHMEMSESLSATPAPADFAANEPAMQKSAAGGPDLVAPTIRTQFADTAFWKADLETDADGMAHVSFDMPENLTGWKLRAWGLGAGTSVGEGTNEVVTAKDLVVRLQAPRFFTQTDEVVLSAVVHNYLPTEKNVQVELVLEGNTLQLMTNDASTQVSIPAQGETRVDWRVKASEAGIASVTMKALTDEESDAMQMSFPVQVHGILKAESFSGVIRPDKDSGSLTFQIPEERKPEQSRLELRYSPTLAGAMVDALPYLVNYPYGCTEQTLNRFLPTVITQRILQNMNLDLAAIRDKRTNLNAQQIGDDQERAQQWKRYDRNPVFDEDEVALMVKQGVKDLSAMQNSDGGWGWFSGYGEHSYPHTTAVVVHGLQIAAKNDVAVLEGVLENGIAWLNKYQAEQIALLQEGERHAEDPDRKEQYKSQADNMDALVFSVLVDGGVIESEMQRFLYRDRTELSLYSQSLLGLALHAIGANDQRDMVIRNIDQFVTVDNENQTAYIDLPNTNYWWYWYGNNVEANAHYLKLLTKVDPQGEKAAGLVKYLINNRKHGTYWNSTRDTAYSIEALADYLVASGEANPHQQVEIWLDGELRQTVEITPEVLFTFDNSFVVEGVDLTAGEHQLEIRRKGLGEESEPVGPLYYNAYVTNFTMEEFITSAGLEINVQRKYYKLVQDKSASTSVAGSNGQVVDQARLKYDRVELKSMDEVVSGDLIEIELEIDSKNDYEYIVFEDLKAAGCEPVDVRSGYTSGGLGAFVEFRDEKVAFFLRQLSRGKHSVSYRVRAEVPGKFSALPTVAEAMYAPELRANSDEMKLQITDQGE